jgi:hypothetical protein
MGYVNVFQFVDNEYYKLLFLLYVLDSCLTFFRTCSIWQKNCFSLALGHLSSLCMFTIIGSVQLQDFCKGFQCKSY